MMQVCSVNILLIAVVEKSAFVFFLTSFNNVKIGVMPFDVSKSFFFTCEKTLLLLSFIEAYFL